MAKTINSLKEHLDYIKKELFNGNGLNGITEMSAEERVEFIKKNVDRLLENERNAMWLGDQFWTADKDRIIIYGVKNYFFNADELAKLTEAEQAEVEFLKDFAGLCHDLSLHFPFDNTLIGWPRYRPFAFNTPGLGDAIKALAEDYPHMAAHMANLMLKESTFECSRLCYQPAQDYLAELYDFDSKMNLYRMPSPSEMPHCVYAEKVTTLLQGLADHIAEGRRLGMCLGAIIVHDTMFTDIREFDNEVVPVSKDLWQYIDREMYIKAINDFDTYTPDSPFDNLPEHQKQQLRELLTSLMKRVDKAYADAGFSESWIKRNLPHMYFEDFGEWVINKHYDDIDVLFELRV